MTKTFAGLIGCVLLAACSGAVVTTGERGAEPFPGAGRGGAAGRGGPASQGGGPAEGSSGSAIAPSGPEPVDVLPEAAGAAFDAMMIRGPSKYRPHSLDVSLSRGLVLILGRSLTDRAGPSLQSGKTIQSFSMEPLESPIWYSPAAPIGGLRGSAPVPLDPWLTEVEKIVLDDAVVAHALVVWKGYALRKRVGEHGGTVFERIDLAARTVERLGPEASGADEEPGRLAVDGGPTPETSTFFWSVDTGGADGGIYRANIATGGATQIAPDGHGEVRVIGGVVLRVLPGKSADGRTTQTLESIDPSGTSRKALFTIAAVGMTTPANIDDHLHVAAQLHPSEPTVLLRIPSGGGAPRIVRAPLCPADPWLPSLADGGVGYVGCPASGEVYRLTPLD